MAILATLIPHALLFVTTTVCPCVKLCALCAILMIMMLLHWLMPVVISGGETRNNKVSLELCFLVSQTLSQFLWQGQGSGTRSIPHTIVAVPHVLINCLFDAWCEGLTILFLKIWFIWDIMAHRLVHTGPLLYMTSIICHFPRLLCRACWLLNEWPTLIQ
jgi:hypothetical protein